MLVGALLAPALATADTRFHERDFDAHRHWLGFGLGYGSIGSDSPAPSADRKVISGSIETGYRLTPEWGLGVEFGVVAPTTGCDGKGCTALLPDFAPNFTRWFLLGEYRPGDSGMSIGLGAGLSLMCYRYYETDRWTWGQVVAALVFGDDGDGARGRATGCKRLGAFGASASIGYQWSLGEDEPATLGLRLRGETAKFAASPKANTPEFRHRAVMMQLQLIFN